MKQCLGHFLFLLQLRFIYCRGVARIFKGGTHCVKLRVLTSFRHLNIVGCFLKKRFTNGGLRAPQDPPLPLLRPWETRKTSKTKALKRHDFVT